MKRRLFDVLLAFTAALAILLLGLLIRNAKGGRIARAATTTLTADSVRILHDHDRRTFVVDFGTAMVADEAIGDEAPAGLLRAAPETPLVCRWRTARQLEVEPLRPLRRATRYALHLDPELRSRDGRAFEGEARLTLSTRPPRLASCVALDEDESIPPAVAVSFDMPVAESELLRAVRLRDPSGQDVAYRVERMGALREHAFKLLPEPAAGRVPARVELIVDPSLRGTVGELPMGFRYARDVRFFEPITLRRVRASKNALELAFNRRIPLPDKATIKLDPPVEFQVARTWRGVQLVGAFAAGTAVRVTLDAGFPGTGRARLKSAVSRSARVPDLDPLLAFKRTGSILSALALPQLEVTGVNVARLRVSVRRAYPNNVVRLSQSRHYPPSEVFAPRVSRVIDVRAARNESFLERVDLRPFVGADARGLHLVELRDLDGRADSVRRLFQITDLGVTVRAAPDAVAVHVAGLAKGKPVAGATVRVLTPTNQELCSGLTDGSGIVVLPYTESAADRKPWLVEVCAPAPDTRARHDRPVLDRAFVDLAHHRVDLADDALGGRPYLTDPHEAWVWMDRGVVRPGEEARATVITRDGRGVALAGRALEVRLLDPRGRVRRTERVETTGCGLLLVRFPTGDDAPTGRWQVAVRDTALERRIGATSFRVEAFVPDRLEGEVATLAPLRFGEVGRVRVAGRWLAGGAAAKRPLRLFVRFDHGAFRPEGFEGWSFGSEEPGPPPGLSSVLDAVLDEDGRAELRFELPEATKLRQCLHARIVAEISDPSGRVVRAGAHELVLRDAGHLGVRARPGGASVAFVGAAGELLAEPLRVRVELEKRSWRWRRVPRGDGRFRYETWVAREVVEAKDVAVTGRADVKFEHATTDGWYAVVARTADGVVEQSCGDRPQNPDRLRVSGPDVAVRPGSKTTIEIDAPFAGTAFVTLEGTTIHAARTVPVAAGHSEVAIGLPAGLHVPNVHAVVTLRTAQAVAGRRGPFWIAGGTAIALDRTRRTTEVLVQAQETVVPGARVRARIRAPGASRAVVSLVDEGIRRITGHGDPDPGAWFGAQRRLDSGGADTGTRLVDRPLFTPEVLAGGGDGDDGKGDRRLAGTTSSAIRTVALTREPVTLDAAGEGTVELVLPDHYEGRLRLAAVVAGPRVVGAAAQDVRVRSPLGLLLATPRMLAPGDETELALTVRNTTGAAGDVRLELQPAGGLGLSGERRLTLAMRDGETKTLRVPVVAGPRIGAQGLRVVARLGSAERELTAHCTVRPTAVFDVEQLGIAGDRTRIAVPGAWVDGTLHARVVVDAAPDARLLPAIESLLQYPYGCVEQTTSRCVALLACRSLLRRLYSEGGGPDVDDLLRSGIDRLLAMQTYRGGLSMWPGGDREYPFGTLYGLEFLLDARAAGLPVPTDAVEQMLDSVERRMARAASTSHRAYGVLLLSRAKRSVGTWLERLREVVERSEDRARLALALARTGGKAAVAGFSLEGEHTKRREQGGFLRSSLRERALALRARLVVTPADPSIPVEVEALAAALGEPRRLTTQERGQLLATLAAYYDRNAAAGPPAEIEVRCGGKTHVWQGKPIELADLGGGDIVEIRATGSVYGMLALSGYRTDATAETMEGIELRRTVLDLESGKPATELSRGRVYEVRLTGTCREPIENLLVTDVVPGGCEIENARLGGDLARAPREVRDVHREIRDDRILLFPRKAVQGEFAFSYRMRAVFPGTFAVAGTAVEALYDPSRNARLAPGGRVTVR